MKEANHKKNLIRWYNYLFVCPIDGHEVHISHPKYPSKYCRRCGTHEDNWEDKKVSKRWMIARYVIYYLCAFLSFSMFGRIYKKHPEDEIQLVLLTLSVAVVIMIFCYQLVRYRK